MGAEKKIRLMPMSPDNQVQSCYLTIILQLALERVRSQAPEGYACSVVFIGMDSPQVPASEIERSVEVTKEGPSGAAYICPAMDGGYALLSVPPSAGG